MTLTPPGDCRFLSASILKNVPYGLGITAIGTRFYGSNMTSQALVESDNGQHAADRPADGIGVDSTCGNSECIGESSPVETFSLLANEDRLAILGAVVRAHERGTAPVPFSTLRETVGIRDSGRFSYHLQELTGPLLTRSPDGYSLREGCRTFLVRILASVDVE